MCQCAIEARRRARLNTILEEWPEYKNADLQNFTARSPAQENAAAKLRQNIQASYYFTGLFKRGKSFFLVAQYRALVLAGEKCVLRSARDLAVELRRSEVPATKDSDVVQSQVVDLITTEKHSHLFIDDIEKISNTDFRLEMIWDILDTIKRRELSLTVSSNLPMITKDKRPDLRAKLGDAIVSRLYQICEVIEL
jgi:DNA replication protein DnaC